MNTHNRDDGRDEEVSDVADGAELNPKDRHPPNAENRGVSAVLTSSTALAILAMVAVGVIGFTAFG